MAVEKLVMPEGAKVVLPPHGFIHLQKHCAEDLDVVNAARVSLAKYSTEVGKTEEALIRFLLRNDHTSPFEHTFFKFHIMLPMSTGTQWLRHRIGHSYNLASGRYSEWQEQFYVPSRDDMRTQVGKPGAYTFEPLDEATAREVEGVIDSANKTGFTAYKRLLELGLAKELARNVLGYGLYTQMIWSCNALSLMHFLGRRDDEHAQKDIRVYAQAVRQYFEEIMPITAKAHRDFKWREMLLEEVGEWLLTDDKFYMGPDELVWYLDKRAEMLREVWK